MEGKMRSVLLVTVTVFTLVVGIGGSAFAYIDPGTTSVVFSAIAYVIGGIAVFFAFLIRPFKTLYRKYIKKGGGTEEGSEKAKAKK
jgi:hypothetical protein